MKTDTQIMNELAVSSGFLKPQSSWVITKTTQFSTIENE